ncbi:transcriptional regulator [Mesobacillus thioparans]|uniref:LexA family protein n=1 Tax=Mesobacillus thioparans TaxID=370439 RepID=UPI0039EFF922
MYYYGERKPLKERMEEKEKEILGVIAKLLKKGNHPPSVREITRAAGMNSTSTTFEYLKRLQKKGLIDWEPKKIRTLKIIKKESSAE